MDLNALIKGTVKSKAIWLGVLTVLGSQVPVINAWILAHVSGEWAATLVGVLGVVFRYFTDQSVTEKGGGAAPSA
jgi:hypothetical protein